MLGAGWPERVEAADAHGDVAPEPAGDGVSGRFGGGALGVIDGEEIAKGWMIEGMSSGPA